MQVIELLFTVADPRYIGKDTAEEGSVLLDAEEVRHCNGRSYVRCKRKKN